MNSYFNENEFANCPAQIYKGVISANPPENGSILIKCGLTANTVYAVAIARGERLRLQSIQTDGYGNISLDVEDFDSGFFNQHSPQIYVGVKSNFYAPTFTALTFQSVAYDLLEIQVVYADETTLTIQ